MTSVTTILDQPESGTLDGGQSGSIILEFNEDVTVTGTPSLSLNDGGTASYSGGSSSSDIDFSYTVTATDADVSSLGATALDLDGGSITEASGNSVSLSLASLTQSGPLIDTDAAFVDQLYSTVLLRQPSTEEASSSIESIDTGEPTRSQVIAGVVGSTEAQDFVLPIVRFYEGLLKRAPDAAGFDYWVNVARADTPLTAIASDFLSSAEYQSQHSGAFNAANFITMLYGTLLDRAPDTTGDVYWLDVLAQSGDSPTAQAAVVADFITSAECLNDTTVPIESWLTSAAQTGTYPASITLPSTSASPTNSGNTTSSSGTGTTGTPDGGGGANSSGGAGALTQAPGSETITVTPTTTSVTGNGYDTVIFSEPSNECTIVPAANGGLQVTDTHSTGQSVTVVDAQYLQFSNVIYDVATGATSSSFEPLPPAAIVAPVLPPATEPGDIVSVQLNNATSQAETPRDITFGEVFAQGDLPAGDALIATINGQSVSVQMDVKTTYADGSVDDAVLTLAAPALAANSQTNVMLSRGTAPAPAAAIQSSNILTMGYNGTLTLDFHNADGSVTPDVINVGQALSQALAAGTATVWLQGPLTTAVEISVPINAQMQAQFEIQANADGTFMTDVSVWNDKAFSPATTFSYDVQYSANNQVLFQQSNVTQYEYTSWQQQIWSGTTTAVPQAQVVYDLAYLEQTGAIPAIDTSSGVTPAEISNEQAHVTAAGGGLFSPGDVEQYMPTTGGRPDIGLLSGSEANYLASQSPAEEAVMLADANAAGAVPWHLDDNDGNPITDTSYPNIWADARAASQNVPGPQLATPYDVSNTGWTPDVAHQPDLSYIAYLITGSPYYLEQLESQAAYDLDAEPPYAQYRNGSEGLIIEGQTRSLAWNLRDLLESASIAPNSDPLKSYFETALQNNLNALASMTINNSALKAAGQIEGYIGEPTNSGQVAPWQNDYLVLVLVEAAQQGYSEAGQIAEWMQNFTSGILINGANGYNPLDATSEWLVVSNSNETLYNSWAQLYQANYGGQAAPTSLLDGTSADSYDSYALAANASLFTLDQQIAPLNAYAYLMSLSQGIMASFETEQNWDIMPKLPDGNYLQQNEIAWTPSVGGTLLATTADSMLFTAPTANTTLIGGNGVAILYDGGTGTNTLIGGSGINYFFGGSGTDLITAAGTQNYIQAGSGHGTFTFNAAGIANDAIANFNPALDVIDIHGNTQSMSALIAGATTDAAGDSVLHLSAQHALTLIGVHPAQLEASWFQTV